MTASGVDIDALVARLEGAYSTVFERSLARAAAAAITALVGELDHFKNSGIIEVAIRNASVAEYMNHWEGRTEKAEAERDRLVEEVERLRTEVESLKNFMHNHPGEP